jgi:hypothetical protein
MAWAEIKHLTDADLPTKREMRQVEDYLRRKAKPRFYADENFPNIAVEILRRRDADVLTVHEAMRNGHPDESHAAEALRLGRILITCDRDYLDERRFPLIHCPAVIVCDFGKGSVREIARAFQCLRNVFDVPQFHNKWIKIDASCDSWTERLRFLDGSTAKKRYRIFNKRLQEWRDE